MPSVDRGRAHLRVGVLAIGVFVVLLLAGVDRVASAALPVAIGLLACAAVARGVLWTRFGERQATARRYLEPLSVWCVVAVVVYVIARIAAGDLALGSFALAVALGGVAMLLWLGEQQPVAAEAQPVADPEPPPRAEEPERVAEPARLWSRG